MAGRVLEEPDPSPAGLDRQHQRHALRHACRVSPPSLWQWSGRNRGVQIIAQSVILGGRGCGTGPGTGGLGAGATLTGGREVACFIICSMCTGPTLLRLEDVPVASCGTGFGQPADLTLLRFPRPESSRLATRRFGRVIRPAVLGWPWRRDKSGFPVPRRR